MSRSSPSDSKSPHVVLAIDHFFPHVGGAETLFEELARGLVRAGWTVTVVTRRDHLRDAAGEIRDGFEVRRVRSPGWLGRLGFLAAVLPSLCRAARSADLIHAGGYGSMLPAWLAGLWTRRPVVVTVFEVLGEQMAMLANVPSWAGWVLRCCERLLLALPFARYACISEYTRERLLRLAKIPRDRTDVIYPAVDYEFWAPTRHAARPLRAELGWGNATRVGLYFGRPGVSKGIDTLIDAAELLRTDAAPDRRLVLILSREPASERRRIERAVSDRRLSELVTILPPVPRDELPGYLLAADCVIVPSLSEGFGYSAVEAATLGCRVIASSGHAVEEVIGDAVRLVPPRDPQALAAAIREAWTGDHSLPAPFAARFTVVRHVNGIRELYGRVLRSNEIATSSPTVHDARETYLLIGESETPRNMFQDQGTHQ